jgi:hypothetical protein
MHHLFCMFTTLVPNHCSKSNITCLLAKASGRSTRVIEQYTSHKIRQPAILESQTDLQNTKNKVNNDAVVRLEVTIEKQQQHCQSQPSVMKDLYNQGCRSPLKLATRKRRRTLCTSSKSNKYLVL